MEDNGKYSFQETENSQKIIFEKGCIVDTEILFTEIFGSSFVQNKHVYVDTGKKTDFKKRSLLKISKKIIVEIKTINNRKNRDTNFKNTN